MRTEILHLETAEAAAENGWRVGGSWPMPGHSSGGYHALLRQWVEHLHAKGPTLLIGEGEVARTHFAVALPALLPVVTAGLNDDADHHWDICSGPLRGSFYAHETRGPVYVGPRDFGTVVCQAVLEHVVDPVGALRHLATALIPGGLLLLHTHGPACAEHRYPIDCWRVLRDTLPAVGRYLDLEVVDWLWTPHHCFACYRQP